MLSWNKAIMACENQELFLLIIVWRWVKGFTMGIYSLDMGKSS